MEKRKCVTDFSESDSDFEPMQLPSKKNKRIEMYQSNTEGERIDLTVALDNDNVAGIIKNLQEVTTRLEIVEELTGFSGRSRASPKNFVLC